MKKASLTVLFSLSLLAGAAYAQSDEGGGVRMSTDPNTAAAVEQKAQSIQQQQEQAPQEQPQMKHKTMHHKKMHKHMAKSKAGSAEAASGASQ